MNDNEWIRSFGSKREAQDMQKVLSQHGFGKKQEFQISKENGFYGLKFHPLDEYSISLVIFYSDKVKDMQSFLRGWIACTNTKRSRPKVR